ncbi:MAG: hypothetical protein ACRDIF_02200, partial [Actinomycetota bacterium]
MTETGVHHPEIGVHLRPKWVFTFDRNERSPWSEIRKFDGNDHFLRSFGNLPTPQGVAVGLDGRVYLSGLVGQIYDPGGAVVGGFGFAGTALAISSGGSLLAVDNGDNQVHVANLNGNLVQTFSTGPGSKPRGIAAGLDGLIYVARDLFHDIAV